MNNFEIGQYNRNYADLEYSDCRDLSDLLGVLTSDYNYALKEFKKFNKNSIKATDATTYIEVGLDSSINQFKSFLVSKVQNATFSENYSWKLKSNDNDTSFYRTQAKLKALRKLIKNFAGSFKLQIKNHIDYRENNLIVGGQVIDFELSSNQDAVLKTLFAFDPTSEWDLADFIDEYSRKKNITAETSEQNELYENNTIKRACEEINKRFTKETDFNDNLIIRNTKKIKLNTIIFHPSSLV